MVRFKVIRGSHLMLALSVFILAGVAIFILLQSSSVQHESQNYNLSNAAQYQTEEAKVAETFASQSIHSASLQIEIEKDKPEVPPLHNAPSILVYHTHTHEAYEQDQSNLYEAVESWRTQDATHSVVRVGAALVDELSKLGFFAVHDTTDHELNNIGSSYVRAQETLESYSGEFDLVIDLHRDAYTEGMKLRIGEPENACAQVMMLIGDGGEYVGAEAPNYDENLLFAQKLTTEINRQCIGLARNVTIKHGRFNQHIGNTAVLIEVGHNRNTLQEALRSVPYLAKGIANILK